MERWNHKLNRMVDNPRVNHFLRDLYNLYQKYDLCLGHESPTGTFVIREYNYKDIDYLMTTALDEVSHESRHHR